MRTQLDTTRHMELFNPYQFDTPVHIIGVGATGSWLALFLAKLGITDITVWDFDTIEEHNIPNQAYRVNYDPGTDQDYASDIGRLKVDALYDVVYDMAGANIKIKNEKVTNQRLAGIVFLMVDSMEARKEIWENCLKMKSAVKLVIEPRMGLDVGRIYNVNPISIKEMQEYEKTYYADDEVEEVSACGASMTVVSSAVAIASWCARQLINFNDDTELDNEILLDFKYNNIITTKW